MTDAELKIEKLAGQEQWNLWKFQVKILLNASDLLRYVNGEAKFPLVGGTIKEENLAAAENAWKRGDSKAQKIIATTMATQSLLHIINCTTARDMWLKLEAVYEAKSKESIHMLQQRFYMFAMDPADDVATHISKLQTLVQQLADVGEKMSDSMVITKVLMTLPEHYSHFYSAWESTAKAEQTLDNLTSRLVMEEARFKSHQACSGESGSNALMAKKYGHNYKRSQEKGRQQLKQGKCFVCKKSGHWKRDCPERLMKGKPNSKRGDAFICETTAAEQIGKRDMWFLDSGASDHMTNRREWLINYTSFKTPVIVRIGNGTTICAIGKGDINVLSFVDSSWKQNHMVDVLYVPHIHVNLFSLNTALDKGLRFFSDSFKCKLIKNGTTLAVGVRQSKLFKLLIKVKIDELDQISANIALKRTDTLQLWHEKLAHQNLSQVRYILKDFQIPFVDKCEFICSGCMYGKQHRAVFSHSKSKSTSILQLVHTDVCGPMQQQSIGGSKYFLLFKDDYSHYRKVYFIKEKSEVCRFLQIFLKEVEAETGFRVKVLRSDNGLEYINKNVELLLNTQSVIHQKTVPYTPEQNGSAEREMRTIVEAARSMIHAKNLSYKFWAEAVSTAVHVLNKTGTSTVQGKTPHELWFGEKPEIGYLRVFGTEVFIHVPDQKRRKLDAKSKKGYFVGYQDGVKGYRVYIPEQNKIEISRNVIFNNIGTQSMGENEQGNKISLTIEEDEQDVKADGENDSGKAIEDDSGVIKSSNIDCSDHIIKESSDAIDCGNTVCKSADEQNLSNPEESPADIRSRLRKRNTNQNKGSVNFSVMESFALLAETNSPTSYEDAISCQDFKQWRAAMDEEISSLARNETWTLVALPKNRKLVDTKWVYQKKSATENEDMRFKARLVARGFSQKYGIDYLETFSPVAKFSSVRAILSIAAAEKLNIMQFDVKTAFLNGNIEEEIYVQQPKGYNDNSGRVCKLQKSLYGLKQSSRCWNKTFTKLLRDFDLRPSDADLCVFVNHRHNKKIILAIYIDDGLMAATDENDIVSLCDYLRRNFEVKVFPAKHFLGLEIRRLQNGSIHLNQSQYAGRVLQRFNLADAAVVSTPADSSINAAEISEAMNEEIEFPFRQAVGSLMYLMVATRPDLSFAVGCVSRYLDKPSKIHVNMVKRILRYLKGTLDHGIFFENNLNFTLSCYSDADYAGDVRTRRSTSGFVFLLGSSCITWASQRQKCVALSTTESEYVAAAEAVKELVWIKQLLGDLLPNQNIKAVLNVDNQGAIRLIRNPEFHRRTKHIDVRFHFIREKYTDGLFELEYVHTDNQVSDIFTKPLAKDRFFRLRYLMNIINFEKQKLMN